METLQQYVARLNQELQTTQAALIHLLTLANVDQLVPAPPASMNALLWQHTQLIKRLGELSLLLEAEHLSAWNASRRRSVLASLLTKGRARKQSI